MDGNLEIQFLVLALHLTTGGLGQLQKPPGCVSGDERLDGMTSKASFYSKYYEYTDLKP